MHNEPVEVSGKFASPEDTILSQSEWHRLDDEISDRQWGDILGVVKKPRRRTRSGLPAKMDART